MSDGRDDDFLKTWNMWQWVKEENPRDQSFWKQFSFYQTGCCSLHGVTTSAQHFSQEGSCMFGGRVNLSAATAEIPRVDVFLGRWVLIDHCYIDVTTAVLMQFFSWRTNDWTFDPTTFITACKRLGVPSICQKCHIDVQTPPKAFKLPSSVRSSEGGILRGKKSAVDQPVVDEKSSWCEGIADVFHLVSWSEKVSIRGSRWSNESFANCCPSGV